MPLTEQKIRSFRPEPGKKQRLFDGRGLYLEISPTGGTYWSGKSTIAFEKRNEDMYKGFPIILFAQWYESLGGSQNPHYSDLL